MDDLPDKLRQLSRMSGSRVADAAADEIERLAGDIAWQRFAASMWRRSYGVAEYANGVLRRQMTWYRALAWQRSGQDGG